jgi:4-hydroxybenzoate polyprenyltransferase
MFYLIIAILLALYYFFMAPKTVRNTLNAIVLVGVVAVLLVLAAMSFIKIMESPPEIFVVIGMIVLAYFAIRDILNMPDRPSKK